MRLPSFLQITVALALAVSSVARVAADDLAWGPGGQGGDGAWNTANWWDGTTNINWVFGNSATFAGTAGTIDSYTFGPSVSALTFNTPGYVIQNGYLNASGSSLTVVTNADATISSTLSGSGVNPTLVKSGEARLTISGSNFLDVRIDAGELVAKNLFFSDVAIADSPNVNLTLTPSFSSNTISVGSLSGGGAFGGTVRPDAVARTVTMTLWDAGNFFGVLSDNGPGKLAVSVFSQDVATLSGVNLYSGPTTARSGTLSFAGRGSALNSTTVGAEPGGVLRLDNSSMVDSNRLSDSAPVTLLGGRFELIGNATQPVSENVGTLNISAVGQLQITQSGNVPAFLSFTGFNRQMHASLDVTGATGVTLPGTANRPSGILPTYITAGNEWAALDAAGRVQPISDYGNLNSPANHVKVSGSAVLDASASRATLNFQGTGTLDLAGNQLTLREGGILASGGVHEIANGTLIDTSGELVVTNRTDLVISGSLSGTALTKSAAGTLTLTGVNSYTGPTTINEGTLVVSSDANLGTGTTIEFGLGTLRAASSFTSGKNLTRSTTYVSRIDTNGYDVKFTGENSALTKLGAGKLTLTNTAIGSASISQGILDLPNPASGRVTLQGGTLLAAGLLDSIGVMNSSALDIGGDPVATLQTLSLLNYSSSSKLTMRMGVANAGSDLLTIMSSSPLFGFASSSLCLISPISAVRSSE